MKIRDHSSSLFGILFGFLCICFPLDLSAQVVVSGTVIDSQTRESLPGVSISIQNTTSGTVTDANGEFQLTVPTLNETLVFSYVGFQTQSVVLEGRTRLNVELVQMAVVGDELIVIGYGVQRQRDLSTSISTVRSEDFNRGAILSPQQLIQGRMSGVNISQNSGKPGGSNTVLIRGGTSVTGSNEPLYVIDGVPIATSSVLRQNSINQGGDVTYFDQEPENPLNALNPNDIESITILKDASATAIYGSRGANGVVVITTKGGQAGGLQTSYDTRIGFSSVAKKLDVLSADEYRKLNQELGLTIKDGGANMFYQDEIFTKGVSQNHDLAFSGGTEATRYRASLGYASQEGIIRGSQLENLNARINAHHTAFDGRLMLDFRINAAQIESHNAPTSNTVSGEPGTNVLFDAYRFNPTLPVFDADGNYNHMSQFNVNPASYAEHLEDISTTRRVLTSLSTTYQVVEFLNVNVNLGYTHQEIGRNSYVHRASPLGGGFGGRASTQSTNDWSNLLETTFHFNQTFGADHNVEGIAGYSYQYFRDEGYNIRALGFLTDAFKWNSIQAASTIDNVSTFAESNKLISFYTRWNYNYRGKYLLTATLRRDGSSRFGSGNEWGIFPSASVGWRIYEEEFFPKEGVINDLKLRVSYGVTGNQEIGNLNSISTLGALAQGYLVGGSRRTIVLPQQFANPNLKWEETSQLDIGLDLEVFRGRIYGKIDYYIKETNDLLLRFPVPSPSVVSTQLANVGAVENRGFEFEIGSYIIQESNRVWQVDLNLSLNRNKVLSLSDDIWSTSEINYANVQGAGLTNVVAQRIRPGKSLGTFYGRVFTGVIDGKEQYANDGAETIIGNAEPDFIFGIGNSFFINNWDLNLNIRGSVGNDVLNNTALNLSYKSNLPATNILSSARNDGVDRGEPKGYSSRWIEDGSFVRLDNITLGYTFNVENLVFLKSARVYATGQNLFVITRYSGLDPEVNSDVTGSGRAPLGIDYLMYPRARTLMLGASLSF